jgi:GAF domain-containing protein
MDLHPPNSIELPTQIGQILTQARTPETLLAELMPAVGEYLNCDRCFVYLRDPQTRWGGVPFCWRRNVDIPEIYNEHWQLEPESLASEDPMFAAALQTQPSIFVEDVQASDDRILNRQFEAENFGHRALIHAHLCHDGQLWGVLQPCVFDRPRIWTQVERTTIDLLVTEITPIVVGYVVARRDRDWGMRDNRSCLD